MINKVGLSPVYDHSINVGFKEARGQSETPQQIADRVAAEARKLDFNDLDPDRIETIGRSLRGLSASDLNNAAAELERRSGNATADVGSLTWAAGTLRNLAEVRG